MKKIQILGTGCAKCQKLAAVADEAARSLGAPYELQKVTEIREIMSFGVSQTPALVVDGKVKLTGKVPSLDEAKQLIG
ncbi:thioredoxin family protein [Opitutaceae bacterium EW11]|nr:thioredoxin family protein [Opitutaceae bacterium EW11]